MVNKRAKSTPVSVVVPTLNEEGNVVRLVQRIDRSLTNAGIKYEVVFVDDHSTDKTRTVLRSLKKQFPVSVFLKKGEKGKAFSLLEGFSYTKHSTIVMIDADNQYPPEKIPSMVRKIANGADIVVANRVSQQISWKRKLASKLFVTLFGKILHGMDCDVQSGMKAFKKEVFTAVELHPTGWTFDLEFLVKAKKKGFTLDTININFAERIAGATKVSLLTSSWEIATSAVKLKFSLLNPFPLGFSRSRDIVEASTP